MISLETIEQEILELEKKDTSYTVVERLAWLYICRDHMRQEQASARSAERADASGSPFMDACSGKPIGGILAVLNEHMDCLQVVYPKSYESIMERMRQL